MIKKKLRDRGEQSVWLEIENRDLEAVGFLQVLRTANRVLRVKSAEHGIELTSGLRTSRGTRTTLIYFLRK